MTGLALVNEWLLHMLYICRFNDKFKTSVY